MLTYAGNFYLSGNMEKNLHAVTVIYINKDFENRVCAFSFANIIYIIIILVAFYSL